MKQVLEHAEEKMKKSVHVLTEEYTAVRAGRANPAVLDKIMVDYYGAPTAINQLAAVSAAEETSSLSAFSAEALSCTEVLSVTVVSAAVSVPPFPPQPASRDTDRASAAIRDNAFFMISSIPKRFSWK